MMIGDHLSLEIAAGAPVVKCSDRWPASLAAGSVARYGGW